MMQCWLLLGIIVALTGQSSADNYDDDYDDSPLQYYEAEEEEGLPVVVKRDLEFNQYVPSYRLRGGEPTCEELRTMWRLSKREARRATTTNELPRSRPYSYGRLIPFAHEGSSNSRYSNGIRTFLPPPTGSYATLARMVGPANPGTFNRLKNLIRMESPSSKGKLNELRNMRIKEMRDDQVSGKGYAAVKLVDDSPVRPERHSMMYHSGTRRYRPSSGFLGDIMPASSSQSQSQRASWRPISGDQSLRSCSSVRMSSCSQDYDCKCDGQYRCNKGKCKVIENSPGVTDRHGSWYDAPISTDNMGMWNRSPRHQ